MEQQPQKDIFSRYGGRLFKHQMHDVISRIPLHEHEKEYVKRVMEKFDHPSFSEGVTREEFFKGLDEMAKNQYDPIDSTKVESIKRHFK